MLWMLRIPKLRNIDRQLRRIEQVRRTSHFRGSVREENREKGQQPSPAGAAERAPERFPTAPPLRMLKEQALRTPAPQWVRVVGGLV
jgi:hypothetical protein